MRFKVCIPTSNSLIAITNKTTFRAYLSSIFTILTCSLANVEILNYFSPSDAIAQTWLLAQFSETNYGLGLPKTASTGGGTRLIDPDAIKNGSFTHPRRGIPSLRVGGEKRPSDPESIRNSSSLHPSGRSPSLKLPFIILITPEDGAKTASPQPTLYWYLNDRDTNNRDTFELPLDTDHSVSPSAVTQDSFNGHLRLLTDDPQPMTLFQVEMKIHGGLSSFKLPIAASLQPSKTYRWQVTVQDKRAKEVTASGWIVYTPTDDNIQKSLTRALTIRDRTKIYAEAGYWFEAIDGYTRWLNFKPSDLKARTARNEILKSGFITNKNLDFDSFIGLLNTDVSANH